MSYNCIEFIRREKTAFLTMTRPESLNPLDLEAGREINDALDGMGSDSSLRCLVITGRGRAFSAGGDVKGMLAAVEAGKPDVFMDNLTESLYAIAVKLRRLPIPVVAAVNGTAVGAGMNLALACDLIIASDRASFSQGFSRLALIPGFGGTHLLINQLSWQKAAEIAFLSEMVSAEEMVKLGLINRVVPHETLEEEALILAERLSEGPTLAFGRTKALFLGAMTTDFETHLKTEREMQVRSAATEDFAAGVRALAGKTKPGFTGK
jgi:2-(1,2-epoxy-1,2-dihydrophenyl)acetyl-CoA isomerase